MILKDLIPHSCYGSIATITGDESLDKVRFFLQINKSFIECFENVIISLNSAEGVSIDIVNAYREKWLEIAPKAVILYSSTNAGHMFGTIDLEESILTYIKANLPDTQYLFKTMDDMITDVRMLDLDLPEAGFYYLPSISYESLLKGEEFVPQTTFFIISLANVSSLYGKDVKNKRNTYLKALKDNPNLKPWEMSYDIKFDCETHLQRTVKDITKKCLLDDKTYTKLLNFVRQYQLGDPSHKNIFFTKQGICHYHMWQDTVFEL